MEKGIGSLPMSGSQGVDPSLFDNEIARIAKEDPRGFGDSLVTGLGKIDPQLVEEFKRDLAQLKPSAALIDALQEMVDEILANPQDYEAIRTKYLNQEVPEELLPAFFDPVFFGGLDLALIELEKNVQRPEPPVEMAEGGLPSIAQAIAKMGRRGDTMLAHITPEEARLLRRRGGSGTINPRTGLPEFFIKKIFKSAKSILKGVGRAINKIAKSDIGRIALTIAATYYMGPAGFNIGAGTFTGATLTGIQAAAGSTLVSLAAGDSLENSLKNGITAGATAGFGQAIGQALPAEISNKYVRTAIGNVVTGTGTGLARGQSLEQALRSGVEGAAQSAAIQKLKQTTEPLFGGSFTPGNLPKIEDDSFLKKLPFANPSDATGPYNPIQEFVDSPINYPKQVFQDTTSNIGSYLDRNIGEDPVGKFGDSVSKIGENLNVGTTNAIDNFAIGFNEENPDNEGLAQNIGGGIRKIINIPIDMYEGFDPRTITDKDVTLDYEGSLAKRAGTALRKGVRGVAGATATGLQELGNFGENAYDFSKERVFPGDDRRAYLQNKIAEKAEREYDIERAEILADRSITDKQAAINKAAEVKRAKSKVDPTKLSMYGPAAAVGLGALYAGGAFDSPEEEEGGLLFDPYTFQMFNNSYSPNMYAGSTYRRYNPYLYADGGNVEKFPRKTGAINGPGTGTSDSIPAMLSDGEFVMTAKAVRSMGKGSRRKGAAKMYKLMRELEKRTA